MKEETMDKANKLSERIKSLKEELVKIDKCFKEEKGLQNESSFTLTIYGTASLVIGRENALLMLTLFQKQAENKLEKLEKEFAEL